MAKKNVKKRVVFLSDEQCYALDDVLASAGVPFSGPGADERRPMRETPDVWTLLEEIREAIRDTVDPDADRIIPTESIPATVVKDILSCVPPDALASAGTTLEALDDLERVWLRLNEGQVQLIACQHANLILNAVATLLNRYHGSKKWLRRMARAAACSGHTEKGG